MKIARPPSAYGWMCLHSGGNKNQNYAGQIFYKWWQKKTQADHGEDNKIKILKYNLQVFLERGGSIREIT